MKSRMFKIFKKSIENDNFDKIPYKSWDPSIDKILGVYNYLYIELIPKEDIQTLYDDIYKYMKEKKHNKHTLKSIQVSSRDGMIRIYFDRVLYVYDKETKKYKKLKVPKDQEFQKNTD